MDAICALFLLSSHIVSVVFDFNASLNDVAPASPIQFPVDEKTTTQIHKKALFLSMDSMRFFDSQHAKFISLHGTMFIKRQTLSIVNSPPNLPINNKNDYTEILFQQAQENSSN